MGIIVSTAAVAVLLVLTLDAFGVLPEQVEEVVEPEPVEAPVEEAVETQADQLRFQEKRINDQAEEIEDTWIDNGSASYTIDT